MLRPAFLQTNSPFLVANSQLSFRPVIPDPADPTGDVGGGDRWHWHLLAKEASEWLSSLCFELRSGDLGQRVQPWKVPVRVPWRKWVALSQIQSGLSCYSDLELLSPPPPRTKNWTPGVLSVSHLPCSGFLKTQITESRDHDAQRRGRMGASEEVIQQSSFPQNPHKCRVGVAASLWFQPWKAESTESPEQTS